METSHIGVGPIDAAIKAITSLVEDTVNISLDEYKLEAITGGTDALAETFVKISDDRGNNTTGRATREDIILSSVVAVINSINRIIELRETF